MSTEATRLSIIIVSWNTCGLLAQCLVSVFNTVAAPSLEVFVVDNGSRDGSAAMVRHRFPQVRLIENRENVGFARANNQAIRKCTGRFLLLLNSDTVAIQSSVDTMVAFLAQHCEVGLLGPALIDGHGSVQPSWAAFPSLWSELLGYHSRSREVFEGRGPRDPDSTAYEVDWLTGACLLARKEAIDHVGLLDERFFVYSEETDWCRRMKAAGWRIVYLPEVKIIHLGERTTARVSQNALFLLYRGKIQYARKHFGTLGAEVLRVGLSLRLLLAALVRAFQRNDDLARTRWFVLKRLWRA